MEHSAIYYTFLRWTKWSKRCGFFYRFCESKVPEYTLDSLLELKNGSEVDSKSCWFDQRRQELLDLLKTHEYGYSPQYPAKLRYNKVETDSEALDGKSIRKQIEISLHPDKEDSKMNLLIYLPKAAKKPVPLIIGLNFYGNQTIHQDPNIFLPTSWMRNNVKYGITNHKATEASRGVRNYRWPVEYVNSEQFGLATIYYGDICPDRDDGLEIGINKLYRTSESQERQDDEWGAISAWAWALSRAMDYFEQDRDIDEKKIAVMGHSRLGKTSLWAGAQDERFSYIIASASGCGGAAISKRCFGETLKLINTRFPHWFCKNFRKFNAKEEELPIDQHMLIALSAPRPLYVSMADRDLWADPKGMYRAMQESDEVYKFLGKQGLPAGHTLDVGEKHHGTLGFHMRAGGHDVLKEDWVQYIKFIKMHMKKEKI